MARDITAEAASILNRVWSEICALAEKETLKDFLDDQSLLESISCAINSQTKSYRYVLPTQIVAKLADSTLDCRCLQASRGGQGAFDARTIAHKVIVSFDQSNENVLGGSPEPYVNNPLRVPEISEQYRSAQKNQKDWNHLIRILNFIERKKVVSFTELLFRQVLTEIYRRLSNTRVVYPTPKRISLKKCIELLEVFLSERSGGDRLLAITSALFSVIGKRFKLYSDVHRGNTTSADTATGMIADLECSSEDGKIVLAVEVKDRELTISQLQDKIPNMREKQVLELFFIAQKGVSTKDETDIESLLDREFVSGHNIYITDLISLSNVVLALFGENGRQEFLKEIAHQLDEYRSDIGHRRTWAGLLAKV
jgi:hypothetical protein